MTCQQRVQGAVVQSVQLRARHHGRVPSPHDADAAGDGFRGQGVIAGDHDDADPGPSAGVHRVPHLRPGRVVHPGQPQEGQPRFGVSKRRVRTGDPPPGDRQHAKALAGHPLRGRGDLGTAFVRQRFTATAPVDGITAGEQLQRRALDVRQVAAAEVAMHGAHQLASGIEGMLRHSRRTGLLSRRIQAGLHSGHQQGALGGVAEHPPPVPADRGHQPGVAAQSRRPQQLPHRCGVGDLADGRVPHSGHSVRYTVRPQPYDGHLGLGERACLVGAHHARRTERLHREQLLDEGVPASHAADADRQGHGERGRQTLGHQRDHHPEREDERVHERLPAGHAHREQDGPRHQRDARHPAGHGRDLPLQRGLLPGRRSGEPEDPPELRGRPGGAHDGLARTRDDIRAHEHEVARFQRRPRRHRSVDPCDGVTLARERRVVDGDLVRLDQAAVGRHRVPGLQEYDITGNQIARGQVPRYSVPEHPAGVRHHRLQGLRRPLGGVLLGEADAGVQQHHAEDGQRQLKCGRIPGLFQPVCEEGDRRGDEQHDGEEVGELCDQASPHVPTAHAGKLVEAVAGLPRGGLGRSETARGTAEDGEDFPDGQGGEGRSGGTRPVPQRFGCGERSVRRWAALAQHGRSPPGRFTAHRYHRMPQAAPAARAARSR